jgi:hypothetical protein
VLPHFGTESLSTRCAEEPTTLPLRELGFGEASVEEVLAEPAWRGRCATSRFTVRGGRRLTTNSDVMGVARRQGLLSRSRGGRWVMGGVKGAERRRR